MKFNKFKVLKIIKNCIIILLVIICSSAYTKSVSAEENKVVRVGFPIIRGFTEKKGGIYTGYVYDYLREISIYTGWEYEFVEKSLNELLNDLRDGNIDILSGMIKNEATMEIFDFPKYESGKTYTTLAVLDNSVFDKSKYVILDGINVGYIEKAENGLNNFFNFCEENQIKDINLIQYPNEGGRELLLEKMKAGEIDAIIGSDLTTGSDEEVIAKFGGNPHYFATTKGNSEVIKGLDSAIYRIKEDNPSFDQDLYNKYFNQNNSNTLILTENEVNYIENMAPIKAAYIDGLIPIQYYDEDTKQPEGIFVDTMNLISEKSGIIFDFVRVKTYEEAYEMIRNDKIDIIIGAANDYLIADKNDFILTKAYLKLDLLKVVNVEKQNKMNKQIVALPRGHGHINLTGEYEIKYYDNIKDCLKAVNEGVATTTYWDSYSISNYIAEGYYNNINIINNADKVEIIVGISKAMNEDLRNILNKAVYSLSDRDIQNIVQQATLKIKNSISLKDFFLNNLVLCLTIIGIVLIVISILVCMLIKMRFDKIEEDKKRLFEKTQIDSLTGVYNRGACEELVGRYLKEKGDSLYYTFIIIDIDYFKQINDHFGHQVGDNLLIEFSNILKESFSNKDIISRLGGDEFIIFIKDIEEHNIKNIEETIEKLCKIMDKEVWYNEVSQKISLSLGAIMTTKNMEFNKLYTMADAILYEVKRNGRNGCKIKKFN